MFGIFKRSTVVRKSEDKFDKSETKWFKGQKVKLNLEQLVLVRLTIERNKKLQDKLGLERSHYQFQS